MRFLVREKAGICDGVPSTEVSLTFVLGAQNNRLIETILLSTRNNCFGLEEFTHSRGLSLMILGAFRIM